MLGLSSSSSRSADSNKFLQRSPLQPLIRNISRVDAYAGDRPGSHTLHRLTEVNRVWTTRCWSARAWWRSFTLVPCLFSSYGRWIFGVLALLLFSTIAARFERIGRVFEENLPLCLGLCVYCLEQDEPACRQSGLHPRVRTNMQGLQSSACNFRFSLRQRRASERCIVSTAIMSVLPPHFFACLLLLPLSS